MVSDKFTLEYIFIPKVYDILQEEWMSSNIYYSKFIQLKDLGIEPNHELSIAEKNYFEKVHTDFYKIVDEKKWILNKLKYAF